MRIYATLIALMIATSTHAAPTLERDDMGQFIASQSFLERVEQARQTVGQSATELVATSMSFLGVPYKRGGTSVETGFDCSGFVWAMYEQTLGLILPRRAEQQAAATDKIDRADLQPGDLVFFNTMRRAFSHVGIYLGDGKFIHSPRSGSEVRVEDMGLSYWKKRFDGARRVQTPPLTDPALR